MTSFQGRFLVWSLNYISKKGVIVIFVEKRVKSLKIKGFKIKNECLT